VDKDKRRIRLGMKQLQPTSADEFIAEHKTGDMVSGRLMDVSVGRARVELGEGVHAICRTKEAASTAAKPQANSAKADVSTMSALLTAKWKTGGTAAAQETGPEPLRPGQIRTFRITLLDPAQKKIEVELA
jgi:small subunit ribosomal protein S1